MSSTDPRNSLERFVERSLRWLGDRLLTALGAILCGIVLGVVIGGKTGQVEVSDKVAWGTVGAMVLLVVGGMFYLSRSRTRRENNALRKQVERLEEVVAVNAQEDAARTADTRKAERGFERLAAYCAAEHLVIKALTKAARAIASDPNYDINRFIEANSRKVNDTFTTELGQDQSGKVEFECGVVRRVEHGFLVTHASNRHTYEYKRNGPCYTAGDENIEDLLCSKATSDFEGGTAFSRRLEDDGSGMEHYFFALSTAPLGDIEVASLERHASLVSQTFGIGPQGTARM